MAISDAPAAVQGIFALDIVTASLALILFAVELILIARALRFRSRRSSRPYHEVTSSGETPNTYKTPIGTFAFLLPGTVLLCLAYAVAAATAALQYGGASGELAVSITPAYEYYFTDGTSSSSSQDSSSSSSISAEVTSRLTFVNAIALFLYTTLSTGAVWLHSSHVTSKGLNIGSPSWRSTIWNTLILSAMLGTGLASWVQAVSIRRSGEQTYGSVMQSDLPSKALYIAFRCTVILASTSVSVEAVRSYRRVNADGLPMNSERPILARLAFYAVPIWALRNVFLVVDIVMLYTDSKSWSMAAREATAFLFVIFGQIADLAIFTIVAWGAWSSTRS